MNLSELLSQADLIYAPRSGEAEITSVVMDSRKASPGALFVCMPGTNSDSLSFIPAAAAQGAAAVSVFNQRGADLAKSAGIVSVMFRSDGLAYNEALWRLCRAFFHSPTREMKVVGVTGTNGKTTTAWLVRDMLAALGVRAGYLGTLGLQLPGTERELSNTTPFAVELYNLLNEARQSGTEALAMEVSSHALHERRSDGIEFDAAVFTNLTQDHLDYHTSMAAYAEAKHRLFVELPKQTDKRFVGAFNIDDPVGERWSVEQNGPSLTYSLKKEADLVGTAVDVQVDRIRLRLDNGDAIEVDIPLGGNFNVSNCLGAAAGLLALGYSLGEVGRALPEVHPVPDRFEAVPNAKGIGVLIDYAHTPDALEKLLDSVRDLRPKRIVTVFGCGGDRDAAKRPKMAKAASERSDVTIVTSDNPRTEDPVTILNQVKAGVISGRDSVAIIDRREAVAHAIQIAEPGDVVVIAGKGHENYQIIGRTKYPMDDRELAREALA